MHIPRPTALVPVVALALLLSACGPGTAPGASSGSGSPSSPSTSATPGASASPTPGVTTPPAPAPGPPAADLRANIVDAMNSGNTAALEAYLAPSVHITYAATEVEGDVTNRARIIQNITEATGPGVTWNFSLSAAVVDNYRNNPGHYPAYVDDFPAGAVVGKSSENKVISFAISGGLITRIFIANDEYALTFV